MNLYGLPAAPRRRYPGVRSGPWAPKIAWEAWRLHLRALRTSPGSQAVKCDEARQFPFGKPFDEKAAAERLRLKNRARRVRQGR